MEETGLLNLLKYSVVYPIMRFLFCRYNKHHKVEGQNIVIKDGGATIEVFDICLWCDKKL